MNAFSQLDAAVWREYVDDLNALRGEAEALRRRLGEQGLGPASRRPSADDVRIERQNTEWYVIHPSGEPSECERAEQALVLRYAAYMATRGIEVVRRQYVPPGEVRPIYCDAWVPALTCLSRRRTATAE